MLQNINHERSLFSKIKYSNIFFLKDNTAVFTRNFSELAESSNIRRNLRKKSKRNSIIKISSTSPNFQNLKVSDILISAISDSSNVLEKNSGLNRDSSQTFNDSQLFDYFPKELKHKTPDVFIEDLNHSFNYSIYNLSSTKSEQSNSPNSMRNHFPKSDHFNFSSIYKINYKSPNPSCSFDSINSNLKKALDDQSFFLKSFINKQTDYPENRDDLFLPKAAPHFAENDYSLDNNSQNSYITPLNLHNVDITANIPDDTTNFKSPIQVDEKLNSTKPKPLEYQFNKDMFRYPEDIESYINDSESKVDISPEFASDIMLKKHEYLKRYCQIINNDESVMDLQDNFTRLKDFLLKKTFIKGNKLYSQVHNLIQNYGRSSFMSMLGEDFFHLLFDAFHRRSRSKSYSRIYDKNSLLEFMCFSAYSFGWKLNHSETMILMYHFIKAKQIDNALMVFYKIKNICDVDKIVLDDAWRRPDMTKLQFEKRKRHYQMYNTRIYTGIVSSLLSEISRMRQVELLLRVYMEFNKSMAKTANFQKMYYMQVGEMEDSVDFVQNKHGNYYKISDRVTEDFKSGINKYTVIPRNKLKLRTHTLNSILLMCLSRSMPKLGGQLYTEMAIRQGILIDHVTFRTIICGTPVMNGQTTSKKYTLLVNDFVNEIVNFRYGINLEQLYSSMVDLPIKEPSYLAHQVKRFISEPSDKDNLSKTLKLLVNKNELNGMRYVAGSEREFILGLLVMRNEIEELGLEYSVNIIKEINYFIENHTNKYCIEIFNMLFLNF
ncbi:hypothetical protein AYI70_g5452 [Smittium culicis]|uniref:Uncharacterized protein n=1 Tax=Smittium culicis TaxID=133412 RepID=A0A1R1XUD4_9FUNG|nr:hypothetical protein AYI70_g5452 [Smittium culicis]